MPIALPVVSLRAANQQQAAPGADVENGFVPGPVDPGEHPVTMAKLPYLGVKNHRQTLEYTDEPSANSDWPKYKAYGANCDYGHKLRLHEERDANHQEVADNTGASMP